MASITVLVQVPAFSPAVPTDSALPFIDEAIGALEAERGAPVAAGLGARMHAAAAAHFAALGRERELHAFLARWRSNGRLMTWARMTLAPGCSFAMHCHPNIEVIHVLRGRLHERRLRGDPPSRGPFLAGRAAVLDCDLSALGPDAFEAKSWEAGATLTNEIGSVHRSFTHSDDGETELLVLWGGCHAAIAPEHVPPCERVAAAAAVPAEAEAAPEPPPPKRAKPAAPPKPNCSEWIANALADAGVTTVYGGHGGALVPLVNAVVAHPRLRWVCTRNEANASLMAAAEAKLTQRLACVIATSGPGATNLTTGLLDASLDRCPVLALTGLKPREGLRYSEFQDVEQSRLFAGGGVPFSTAVTSPEALAPLLRDAAAAATTRRTCAHLAIPVDVQASPCPLALRPFCAASAREQIAPPVAGGALDASAAAVAALVRAKPHHRVLVALGARAADAATGDAARALAERLNAPVLTRLDAKGALDERHALAFGVVGVHGKPGLERAAAFIETTELVLALGIDEPSLLVCNKAGLQVRALVTFEPDALCVSARFRASATVVGDLAAACRAVEAALAARDAAGEGAADGAGERAAEGAEVGAATDADAGAHEREAAARRLWAWLHAGKWNAASVAAPRPARFSVQGSDDYDHHPSLNPSLKVVAKVAVAAKRFADAGVRQSARPHPADVLGRLSRALASEAPRPTLCVDTGDVTLWASLCYAHRGRTLSSERLGTMGYALCAGVAAVLALPPPQRAVVVAGDGGFQMTLQELATFAQHKRAGDRLTVVVFDNAMLGRVAFGFVGAEGCELAGPDFVALAKAYGGDGRRLDAAADLNAAIAAAVEAPPGLYVLHVVIDPELKADMATFHDSSVSVMDSG